MKLTFKTVSQQTFTVDAEPTDTVGDPKQKINTSQGHPVASQKIIYSGKILSDDKTVASCNIKEKDFLVVMVSKAKVAAAPKPAPVPAVSTPAPAPAVAPTPATPAAAEPAAPAPAATDATATPAAPSSGAGAFDPSASFISGPALQSTIANMMEMGFERDQVLRALKASFNNPERAVEYLMTGIPEHLANESAGASSSAPAATAPAAATPAALTPAATPAAPAPAAPAAAPRAPAPAGPQNLFAAAQAAQSGGGGGAGGGRGGGGAGLGLQSAEFEQLRNSAAFQQVRELVQQNPAYLQPLVQQLAASNPQLAEQLASQPELLYQLLGGIGAGGPGGLEGEGEGEGGIPPGAIRVTEEEHAAIQRLVGLGFSEQAAVEAYFACGKDENLAANYLFENGNGFDDGP